MTSRPGCRAVSGQAPGPVGVYLATVVRLMRLAAQDGSSALSVELQARLSYAATERCEPSVPLDAYPLPVLAAVRDAALADVRSITARLDAGRALAATGHDPQAAGWHARENVLWHVLEHGPLTASRMRELGWHGNRHGGARELNDDLFLGVNDLVPFLVAVICLTGLEPECAKGLRGDCLSSPSGGFWTLAYDKPRAHTGTGKTMRVRGGNAVTPAGLIQLAIRLTHRPGTPSAAPRCGSAAGDDGLRAYFDQGHQMNTQVQAWMIRHQLDQLTDYGGGRVRLDLRRLRKTVKSGKYLAAGGVLDDFTAGHSRPVAASRYANIGAHREIHERAVEAGLEQALAVALPPPAVIPRGTEPPGMLTSAQLRRSPERPAATCSSPRAPSFNDSPFARKPGGPCPVAVWGCLECPNAVFADRHLPSLVAFAGFLQDQREVLSETEWAARYGLSWQRLADGVFPAFPPEQLEAARTTAAADDSRRVPRPVCWDSSRDRRHGGSRICPGSRHAWPRVLSRA